MERFSKSEQLGENDMWYCPTCKEHRPAFKKMDIYKVPDILVVHLKRFQYTAGTYFVHNSKIEDLVVFPIEGLDLSRHVVGPGGGSLVYDLFAVSVRLVLSSRLQCVACVRTEALRDCAGVACRTTPAAWVAATTPRTGRTSVTACGTTSTTRTCRRWTRRAL